MKKRLVCFLSLVFIGAALAACSSGSGSDGVAAGVDLSGAWHGVGMYHTDNHGNPLSMPFTMDLTIVHSGTLVQGSYTVVRAGASGMTRTMMGTIAGTFDGTDITMTFSPHGRAWGTAASGVMNLNWFEDFGGGTGSSGTVSLGRG